MSEKIIKPVTVAQTSTKIVTAVRKPPAKKAAAKITAVKAAAVKAVVATEKKPKKSKKSDGKVKVVRDSFTMPQGDYDKIGELKQLCSKSGMHVKKSELLRAGLYALAKLSVAQLKTAISGLETIKTGRPKKD